MFRKSCLLACLLIAALTAVSYASNGTQIGTVGARATAMGSNFRGLANDWTAFFYNPAGLAQLKGLTIGGSLGIIMPRGSYQPYAFPGSPWNGLYTDERIMKEQNFFIPSLAVFYNFGERLTVGVGVAAPFGLGAQFDLIQVPDGYRGAGEEPVTLADDYETQSDHQVLNVQPTVAFRVIDGLSIGAGFGYMAIGKMSLRTVALPEYSKLIATSGNAAAIAGYQTLMVLLQGRHPSGIFPDVYNDAHSRLIVENFLDGSGHAYGLSFGIHYKPYESFSVGFSGRYYTDLKLKGTMDQTVHFPGGAATYIQTLSAVFGAIPGNNMVDSLTAIGGTRAIFTGADQVTAYDEVEADLPLPLTLGLGVAVKPLDRVTLTADASWTNWASWDTILVQLAEDNTEEMVQNWASTLEVGAGVEVRALEMKDIALDVRAGFYMVDTPSPFKTITPTILDPNRRTIVSAGLGFKFLFMQLNLAYERVIIADQDIKSYWYQFNELGMNENWAGVYKMNANVFTADLTITL